MHHVETLGTLEFGELHFESGLALSAVSLEGSFEPLLGMLLLFGVQDLKRLFDSSGHFVVLEGSVGVVLVEDFAMFVLLLGCLAFPVLDVLGDFGLGELPLAEGFLLFV